MSKIQTGIVKNPASAINNLVLNSDGSVTFGGLVSFADGQTFVNPVSTIAPTNPSIGATWYDVSVSPYLLKIYNGVSWVAVTNLASVNSPTSPFEGQLWVDLSGTHWVLRLYDKGTWVPASYVVSNSAPTGASVGQLWSDVSTTPATLRAWDGAAWSPVLAGSDPALTVTSFSGGTTGLTPTLPTTGDIVLDGVLAIAHGGTGSSTLAELSIAALPSQGGNAGLFLSTDGTNAFWDTTPTNGLPDQLGQAGKYLTTNGTVTSWASAYPDQTGQAGKVLSTDGTNVSWEASAGGGTVTQVDTGYGLTGGPITASGTIDLDTSGVTAGSYTSADITVDQYGRVTAAADGGGTSTIVAAIGESPYLFSTAGTSTFTVPTGATKVKVILCGGGGFGETRGGGNAAIIGYDGQSSVAHQWYGNITDLTTTGELSITVGNLGTTNVYGGTSKVEGDVLTLQVPGGYTYGGTTTPPARYDNPDTVSPELTSTGIYPYLSRGRGYVNPPSGLYYNYGSDPPFPVYFLCTGGATYQTAGIVVLYFS